MKKTIKGLFEQVAFLFWTPSVPKNVEEREDKLIRKVVADVSSGNTFLSHGKRNL